MNRVIGGIPINSMKLILSIMAMGMLIAMGSAFDDMGMEHSELATYGGDNEGNLDFGGHGHHDWLNPGGYVSYSYGYPAYAYSWYPRYTYTYPTYTYPTYVYPTYTYPTYTYPTYTYYYSPVYDPWYAAADPWYAANVYGWTGTTYYYSGEWSLYRSGGYYFL